jgi:alkyl sulfatase BDS1-like metallo-beta-lactamase superfamily hydrolase
MHVVEGREGIVVIDPLVSAETTAAALALYREHRGDRPVTGLIYTHSHVDHFGGAKGVLSAEEIESRRIPILAPAGFLHHAVSENVFAGTTMARRAGYMYGALLERGPSGQIGSGLGQTTSLGTITLIPPNLDVVETGQEELVDGVRMRLVEREALNQLLLKTADIGELGQSGRLRVEGDGIKLGELLGLLDEPDPGFAIVTPD